MTLLDLLPPTEEPGVSHLSIRERFVLFDRRNPQVYRALEDLTRELYRRGQRRIGVKMLIEVLRWQYAMGTNDPTSEFKINNNYSAHYARELMQHHPEWRGVFATRELSDD